MPDSQPYHELGRNVERDSDRSRELDIGASSTAQTEQDAALASGSTCFLADPFACPASAASRIDSSSGPSTSRRLCGGVDPSLCLPDAQVPCSTRRARFALPRTDARS